MQLIVVGHMIMVLNKSKELIRMKSAATNLDRISRKMSYLLRHSLEFIDEHGWAKTSDIIKELKKDYPDFNEAYLKEIVQTDAKGRYSFGSFGTKIRANQGHSVPVDVDLTKAVPPEFLYHGTAERFLKSIMQEGLTGQSRLYVHLSSTLETAVKVGARHGKPAILKVHTEQMAKDGFEFFLSENHVWLTKHVPVQYIEKI